MTHDNTTNPDPRSKFAEQLLFGFDVQLNNLAPDCAPLCWKLRPPPRPAPGVSGMAGSSYAEEEVPAVLADWAAALGLTLDPAPMQGATSYVGEIDGAVVEVWGVTDRKAWEQRQAELYGIGGTEAREG